MNYLMDFDNQESEIMHFMDTQEIRQADLFKEILDRNFEQQNDSQLLDFFNPKRIEFGQFYDDLEDLETDQKNCSVDANISAQKPSTLQKLQEKMEQQAEVGILNQKQTGTKIISKRRLKQEKVQRYRGSTKCDSRVQEGEIQLQNVQKSPEIMDYTCSQNEECSQQTKKTKKLRKKIDKFILKEKHFGTTLKISFPKKIVQMFINHYNQFQIQSQQVKKYNNNLKLKLKQTKKNDYTFQKEVSQILGEMKQAQDQIIDQKSSKLISMTNRSIFSEIIKKSMKEQVIMRDKIAKNRQLYMIQLKVYALRCRSHKLSKKGTYK